MSSINIRLIAVAIILFLSHSYAHAQDPALPPPNLSLGNMNDGFSPGPGVYLMNYLQIYESRSYQDHEGNKAPTTLKFKSVAAVFQVVWLSRLTVAGGNLGFTVIAPVVRLTAEDPGRTPPSTNTGVLGDLTVGSAIQWSHRKLFGKMFFHRIELTTTLPTGTHDKRFVINPSAHLYTFTLNHAQTVFLDAKWSVSTRNHISYNTRILDSPARPGIFYNLNYSLERVLVGNVNVEIAGYYLKQVEQDSYDGQHHYYQDRFGIGDTREQVLAIGPGLSWLTPSGVFLEGKVLFETVAKNRFQGIRAAFRLVYNLTK